MSVIKGWLDYLDRMNIHYSHSTHPRAMTALETANAEKMPAHEFAKTVVYYGDTGYGIVVVPADQEVDLAKAARLLGLSWISLAEESELAKLFPHCELGAMPPFGDSCKMPVMVDVGVAGDYIAFTIGTHRDIVRMSFEDFQRLARPTIAAVATGQESLV